MNSPFLGRAKDNPWLPLSLFLGFYLLFSLLTFRSYGIACDENEWYVMGGVYLKHYVHANTAADERDHIFSDQQASHNYFYPAILRALCPKRAPGPLHLLNLLFAVFAYGSAYSALFFAYRKPWWSLSGPVFLFLVFRFSGDVPVNPKDAPFAVLYFASLLWIYLSRHRIKDTRWESIVLGTLVGWTTLVRVVGITLFPILALYRFYEYALETREKGGNVSPWAWVRMEWKNFLLLFFVSQFWVTAFWPYVGSNYFGNMLNVFLLSKRYPYDFPTLFGGRILSSLHLPWDYLPVWFLISLPLFILAFFFASPFLVEWKGRGMAARLYFLLVSTLALHFLMYWTLKPVIYNSMRHYLFLVPVISTVAAMGAVEFFRRDFRPLLKKVVWVLLVVNLATVSTEFFRLFPYQYVYFNELVGGLKGAGGKYEAEYWHTAYREAVLWLEKNELTDPKRTYRIRVNGTDWQETAYFKPNMAGGTEMKKPDYELMEVPYKHPRPADERVIHVVGREGVTFAEVWKRREAR